MEEESDDSLDLLLDTLCNAFGGIILITLLIALMSQEANDAPTKPKSFKTQWMLEQQAISKIENEIIIEESIGASLQSEPGSDASGKVAAALREKETLEQQKQSLTESMKRLQKILSSMPANSSNLAVDLQRQLRQLQSMDVENEESADRLENEIEQIESRLASANRDIQSSKRGRTQTLRLPKEKGKTGKKYIWVIVKYGMIYPIDWEHPSTTKRIFTITEPYDGAFAYSPIRTRGFSPFRNQADIIQYFRTIDSRETYLAFQVFTNDTCFKSFNQAKQIATSMGIGYAWEPRDEDIVLVAKGTAGSKGAGSEL
tara:strand:- start:2149 stop:3093 length:945 start_codon:yes stop_codon:yes gene_type:complete